MTLQQLPSEFPNTYMRKILFYFLSVYQQPSLTGSHLGCARQHVEVAILDKQHRSWVAIVDRQPSWISVAGDWYKWKGDRPPS
jgi:hypothetical protein